MPFNMKILESCIHINMLQLLKLDSGLVYDHSFSIVIISIPIILYTWRLVSD